MNQDATIMVVDDTHESLKLLTEILTGVGYRVRPADSGALALAAISAEPPDLILLDILMPGLDGFEVCRRLKSNDKFRDIPVLFISGMDNVEERIEGLRLGANDFIVKPFMREELLARIGIHLESLRMQKRIGAQIVALQQGNSRAMVELAERKRVEIKMKETLAEAQRFRAALDLLSAHVFMKDMQFRYTYANASTLKIFQCSAAGLVGSDDSRYFSLESVQRLRSIDDCVLRGEHTAKEIELVTKTGERRIYWEVKSPLYSEPGSSTVCGLLGIATDITEHKQAIVALERSQALLRTTAEKAKMGAWEVDLATGLQTWTEEVYRIHGLPLNHQLTAEKGLSFYAPESQPIITEAFRRAAELGEPYDLELFLITAQGERRLVHALGMAQREDGHAGQLGKVVKVSGTFQDLTEIRSAQEQLATTQHARKRAEEALLTSERNAVIGRLAGRVAHEINNPLASIKAYIEPLRRRVADRPEVDEGLEIIDRQVDRVARLVQNLLDFERQRAVTRNPVRLTSVLETVVALLRARADKEGKRLEAIIPTTLPLCTVDADQIQQVLINLLENAFDAVAPGTLVHVTASEQNQGIEVEVCDEGPGLGLDVERLFAPFVSTKEKGCGLGLSLARRICEVHGGWLRGGNRPTGGAWFRFWVPLVMEGRP